MPSWGWWILGGLASIVCIIWIVLHVSVHG